MKEATNSNMGLWIIILSFIAAGITLLCFAAYVGSNSRDAYSKTCIEHNGIPAFNGRYMECLKK